MLHLRPTEEQLQIIETVARALSSADMAAFAAPPGESWATIRDLGIPFMRASAANGGWGAGLFDAVLVSEAAGSQGRLEQVVPSIAGYALLDRLGDPTATIAAADGALAIAVHDGEQLVRQAVIGADSATRIVWRQADRVLIAPLPSAAPGGQSASALRPVATVDLAALAARASPVAEGAAATHAFAAAVAELRVLVAAAQVGLGRQALADAGAYARERVVFGKPIGSYQGVAHALADALTAIDGAGLTVWRAVDAAARGECDAGRIAAEACWWAHKASLQGIRAAMRSFGGYGMTEDSRLPRYYRAARDAGLVFGDPADLTGTAAHPVAIVDPGTPSISFSEGAEEIAWAERARAFVAGQFAAADKDRFAESTDNHFPDLHRRLATAGLLFPDWPTEHGGSGASALATSAARRVLGAAGWPLSVLVVSDTIGKLLMRFGTEAAKAEILPRLADGSAIGCLGLSEPSGGSDVFAARTSAVHDGAGWIVNGQKVFTTSAHIASYVLLLTRTAAPGGAAPGLTLFVAPIDRPGFTASPVQTFAGERTNITFYEDFAIPDRYLLGTAGGGSKVLAATLTLEHSMGDYYLAALESALGEAQASYAALVSLPGLAGRRDRIDAALARARAHATLLECLSKRSQWAGECGAGERWFGPMCKLFGTEAWAAVNADLVDCFAPHSIMPGEPALRTIEAEARRGIPATIYGGSSEIQRSIIAETALQLPRSR